MTVIHVVTYGNSLLSLSLFFFLCVFSVYTVNMSFSCLVASIVSIKNSGVSLFDAFRRSFVFFLWQLLKFFFLLQSAKLCFSLYLPCLGLRDS